MNIVVQKYGGSSVANKEKLEIICDKIISYAKRNINLVVVVSAQGKTTDALLKKAKEYSSTPNKRDLDMLLSTGEMQTASLLSMMLNDRGYNATSLTGEQAGILTDSNFGNATIKSIYIYNILELLKSNKIVVVTGFQAVDRLGNITTLGRGGSDLSAVALAAALKAQKCEIYTDVNGVFSADPNIIPKAKLLKNITYDEMLEAASQGAKVMHNRAVNTGKKHDVQIYVKQTSNQKEDSGSIINKKYVANCIENNQVKFITKKDNLTKISIIGDMVMSNKDLIYDIYKISNEDNITIEMISLSEMAINIVISSEFATTFMNKLHDSIINIDNLNLNIEE